MSATGWFSPSFVRISNELSSSLILLPVFYLLTSNRDERPSTWSSSIPCMYCAAIFFCSLRISTWLTLRKESSSSESSLGSGDSNVEPRRLFLKLCNKDTRVVEALSYLKRFRFWNSAEIRTYSSSGTLLKQLIMSTFFLKRMIMATKKVSLGLRILEYI